MEYREFFHKAAHAADQVVQQLTAEELGKPTPCSEWDVRALLNHMANEIAWVPELMAGKTIAEVGSSLDGDLLGVDPKTSWRKYLEAAMNSVNDTPADQVVHLSYADVTAEHYAVEIGGDLAVHAWDLAKALGVEYHIPEELIPIIEGHLVNMWAPMRDAKMVADEVAVPADADAETTLLAHFGRSQSWPA